MSILKRYREWNPRQQYLLPPCPLDWLPEDDLARFILDVVEELDLTAIEEAYQAKDPRGTQPYDPRMMTTLLLYAYCVGVVSSRKIEQATYRDVSFRVISGEQHPDHTVISEFRRVHLEELKGIYLTTVRLSQEAGLVRLGRVALDGTKIQANASKHKAMSYERMLKTEGELKEEIEQQFSQAEQTDQEEDERYGRDRRGDELPEELMRRKDRLQRIREAKAALEAEAARARAEVLEERAEEQSRRAEETEDPSQRKQATTLSEKWASQAKELRERDSDDEPPPPVDALPSHQVPTTPDGKPTAKAQRNFTDPDSRIMKRDGSYLQGYNCQAAVDDDHQIIVGCALTNQAPDQQHLPPVLEQVQRNCGRYPSELLADSGYWDQAHVGFCEDRGVDPYIATERLKHGEGPPPLSQEELQSADIRDQMRFKLRTDEGRAIYARRKAIVEPVFGQIREAQGIRRFLLRGIEKVRGEWALICAGHNLRKLHRARLAMATA